MAAARLETNRVPLSLQHDLTPHDPYSNNNTSLDMSTKAATGLGENFRFKGFPERNMDSPRRPILGDKPLEPTYNADFRKAQHLHPDRPLGQLGHGFEYGSTGSPHKSEGPRPLGNPLQDKTSADLLKHRQQMEIAEQDIQEFKQWKKHQINAKEEEKRRDLEMLKSYNPWGKAGGGAPNQKEDARLQRFDDDILFNPKTNTKTSEYYPTFGTQGGGAPIRTTSGQIVTEIPKDKLIRFQSDARRTEPMIEPFRYAAGRDKASDLHRALDQQTYEKLVNQQKSRSQELKEEMDMLTFDPFGKPGAGAPLKSKTDRGGSKSENNFDFYDPFGKGTGQPIRDQFGNVARHKNSDKDMGVISFDKGSNEGVSLEVGKFASGGGAPVRAKDGHAVTKMKITMDKDAFGENRFQMDHPMHHMETKTGDDAGYDKWWGREGAGAPIRDNRGNIVTNRRREVDSGDERRKKAAPALLQELQREMVEQQQNKKEMNDSFKQPASDLATIMNKGQTGKPRRDPETGLLTNQSLNVSDVTRMAVDERRQLTNDSHKYHSDLQRLAEERQRIKELEKLRDIQQGQKHQEAYNSFWGRPGAGAPAAPDARKANLDNILNSPRRDHNDYHKVVNTVSGTTTDTDHAGAKGVYARSTLGSNHANLFEFNPPKKQRREYKVNAPWANY
ncbi:uncharacterized protein LOC106159339 isoform X2 [Lingula anatina]|uniref:Uncharacterized protein LOC106159339 isoform X2 n=1 Tax=Lingula anatina TaxID=7574 RepID=A0A1S3HYF5_LINAN|nr:uncharacterized protein LOC106159339 isoform X2 [Lingula anatina]|eukprot:XP_013391057.1 uncharacterized protein LOC106159339 isoform X2 [Lingula anatina]